MSHHLTIESPVGQILLIAEDNALSRLEFVGKPHAVGVPPDSESGSPFLDDVAGQLTEYFAGTRRTFDIAVRPHGTDFQHRV